MSFRPEDLHDFDVAQEVRIETKAAPDKVRSTIIWVMVDGDEIFVRSVRGTRGRWYQDLLADPTINLDDEGRRLEARAIPVHDADSIRRVNDALARKYTGTEGYDSMLTQEALDATVRLDPRSPNEVPLEAPAFLGADEPSELGGPVEVTMLDAGPPLEENIILQPRKPV